MGTVYIELDDGGEWETLRGHVISTKADGRVVVACYEIRDIDDYRTPARLITATVVNQAPTSGALLFLADA